MKRCQVLRGAACAAWLAAPAAAQWVSFQDETLARISAEPLLCTIDPQEKDYAWGDLDQDGWVDLVVARKEPFTSQQGLVNVLLMNEGGVLTDRTALYATASDVPGDHGFETRTNDRDVKLSDVDQDGWLDVVTAAALSFGAHKHITHPRVYVNQQSSGGVWGGLLFEDARIPQLLLGSVPTPPDFNGVAAGDIDEDGDDDLHFVHYGFFGPHLEDRLLVNDGLGFFADESMLRMTPAMLDSDTGTSSFIAELNGLPGKDVVKNFAGVGQAIYNDSSSVGFFKTLQFVQGGLPYFVSQGDLNNDGRIDAVFSDDNQDRYRYNLSTDALGQVVWGQNLAFQFAIGGDDGFGSSSLVVDLDGDAWNDVIICDVDVAISGCARRIHIYHNPGGAVGAEIILKEEAGGPVAGDWKGVGGMTDPDLKGGFDVAAFDIDNDGDNDMVLGRCSGTNAWMNQGPPPFCQLDLGFGGPGATLSLCGTELGTGGSATLAVEAAAAGAPGLLGLGPVFNPTYIPFLDATLVPWVPTGTVPFTTDAAGAFATAVQGGTGPSTWYVQAVVIDAAAPTGFATTNALQVELLP